MSRTATTRALAAPVNHATTDLDSRLGPEWIGVSELPGGDHRLGITVRHADGTCVTAILDEELLDRFAHQLAAIVERRALGPVEPCFPVHQ